MPKENNIGNISHECYNKKISFLGLPLYSEKSKYEGDVLYSFLFGLLRIRKMQNIFRVRLLGIPIFSHRPGFIESFGIVIKKYDIKKKWLKEIARQIDPKYDDIYIFRYHIGETYVELLHLQDRIKLNNSKRPLLLLFVKSHIPLCKMFLPKGMDLQCIPLALADSHRFLTEKQTILNGRRFFCAAPLLVTDLKIQFLKNPKINFYNYINQEIGLSGALNPQLPSISKAANDRVLQEIRRIGLKEKFVVICAEALSMDEMPSAFWQAIIDQLHAKGYDIFVNAYMKELPFKNAKTANLTIEEIFVLAQKSSGVIMLASGLGVLLSAANVPIDLVYTGIRVSQSEYNSSTLLLQTYSVLHLPTASKSLVREYDTAEISEEELIKVIVDRYPAVIK